MLTQGTARCGVVAAQQRLCSLPLFEITSKRLLRSVRSKTTVDARSDGHLRHIVHCSDTCCVGNISVLIVVIVFVDSRKGRPSHGAWYWHSCLFLSLSLTYVIEAGNAGGPLWSMGIHHHTPRNLTFGFRAWGARPCLFASKFLVRCVCSA